MQGNLPGGFDLEEVRKNFPIVYEESTNTVLQQDCSKFNRLLATIRNSLGNIQNALQGRQIMTSALETQLESLLNNKVPKNWLAVSYPSLKPLSSYLNNLSSRVEYFRAWIEQGKPREFNISAFFFTQGFLTSLMQNYSRRHVISIDQVGFDVRVVKKGFEVPEGGDSDEVFVSGMFLEGAGFDFENMVLVESTPRQLYLENFRVKLIPKALNKQASLESIEGKGNFFYECPLYRTTERRGELKTTGHSTNFVTFLELPTEVQPAKWIKRGVALLLELDT